MGQRQLVKVSEAKSENSEVAKATCGIIMPIAAMLPKYEASHWVDVRRVIDAAVDKAGMIPQIVSDSFEGDVIQRRIISNLYENPVVVCDVSGLNPNVMFELGMRITFKQPVVIITDDYATIPFDTKVIEHIGYPRDLHIHQTNEFINKLADKIKRLHEQKISNTFRSFIEEFGTFEVLEPTKKVVEAEQLILDQIVALGQRLDRIQDNRKTRRTHLSIPKSRILTLVAFKLHSEASNEHISQILKTIGMSFELNQEPSVTRRDSGVTIEFVVEGSQDEANMLVKEIMHMLPSDIHDDISTITLS